MIRFKTARRVGAVVPVVALAVLMAGCDEAKDGADPSAGASSEAGADGPGGTSISTLRACAILPEADVVAVTRGTKLSQAPDEQNEGEPNGPLETSRCEYVVVFSGSKDGDPVEQAGTVRLALARSGPTQLPADPATVEVPGLGDGAQWYNEGRQLTVLSRSIKVELTIDALGAGDAVLTDDAAYRPFAEELGRRVLQGLASSGN